MSRFLTTSALALSLVAGFAATASAQSYNAPAGIPAVTAPGGFEGSAGFGNVQRYEQRFGRPAVSVDGVYTSGSVTAAPAGHARAR